MLVAHDIEAEFVGELPLVVIAMQQIGRELGIDAAIRDGDAQRAAVIDPGRGIGLLGEVKDFMRSSPR